LFIWLALSGRIFQQFWGRQRSGFLKRKNGMVFSLKTIPF
jgi:hypothetical protein